MICVSTQLWALFLLDSELIELNLTGSDHVLNLLASLFLN